MATARSFDQQTSGPPPTHPQHDAKTTPSSPPTHPSTNAGHNGHGQGPGRGAPTKMHGHVNLSRACGAPSMRATGGCERARNDTKMQGCCCSRRTEFHPTPPRRGHIRYPGLFLDNIKRFETAFSGYGRRFVRPYRIFGPQRLRIWPVFGLFDLCSWCPKNTHFVWKYTVKQ